MPTVAIYRSALLPASETFIRDEALLLRRYEAVFLGRRRIQGLALPEERVVARDDAPARAPRVARLVPALRSGARLARACRRARIQLVHAHFGPDGVDALELTRALAVPLVVSFRGYDASMTDEALRASGSDAYVRRRLELFQTASALIAVSRFLADELVRKGAPPEKVHVHNMGVAIGSGRARFDGPPTLMFVGRLVEKKGLGDLLHAMAAVQTPISEARLIVVGDGPLRGHLEALARDLGVRVEFLGWRTPEQVRDLMQGARALCVSSKRAANGDAEGLPTVVLEAGALGLPVVGTRHSGIPDVIGGERGGLLADEGDIAGLAVAIGRVLGDGRLWERLSDTAVENMRTNFDPVRQTLVLEALYDAACSGHERG